VLKLKLKLKLNTVFRRDNSYSAELCMGVEVNVCTEERRSDVKMEETA
jgi:hypothetical protein